MTGTFPAIALPTPGHFLEWDSLVDHPCYRTTAVCLESTKLLKLSREKMISVLDEYPYSAALFFRHLAGALGTCLMEQWGRRQEEHTATEVFRVAEPV